MKIASRRYEDVLKSLCESMGRTAKTELRLLPLGADVSAYYDFEIVELVPRRFSWLPWRKYIVLSFNSIQVRFAVMTGPRGPLALSIIQEFELETGRESTVLFVE